MDKDTVWRHIHQQRRALADQLSRLDEGQWEHDSLCAGWTVRDVAAHVISTPAIGWAEMLRMTPSMMRGYNRAIFEDAKRRGRREPAEILADYERYDGSRHHVPTTTHVEPLIDVLVHSQDILRPLGIDHAMPPDAAAAAADRARLLAPLTGSWRLVRSVRMVAEDVDWARGRGPVIEGPMQELLMLSCGRDARVETLSGDGRELLRAG
jgi:uncharacterized protein (TIGR03083 family)